MTLQIRKFETRDIKELFSWFSTEREVLEWAGANMSWPLKQNEMQALVRQHRGKAPVREIWAVWQDGHMVGHFQIGLNRRLRTAGLGRIALAPPLRGHGLSNQLIQLVLSRAFSHDWVHRVDLLVYTQNTPAIRAYHAAGFVLEGTRRETTPLGNEIWSTHIMSLLRNEFDKRTERE
ncbi:MAG: GNAT family protein [Pseudomonadota bacterium]